MTTEQKTNAGTRIGSMLLDHIAMTFIAMIFFIPGMISGFSTAFEITHEQTNIDIFGGLSYVGLIGFAIYFCKDCINGRSIGKRALKLQVVENSSGNVASPIKEVEIDGEIVELYPTIKERIFRYNREI